MNHFLFIFQIMLCRVILELLFILPISYRVFSLRNLNESEQGIYSSNLMHLHVEAIRTFRLVLNFGFDLDLENIFYVPKFL